MSKGKVSTEIYQAAWLAIKGNSILKHIKLIRIEIFVLSLVTLGLINLRSWWLCTIAGGHR